VQVHELLPCREAQEVLAQRNRPFFVLCRMTALVRDVTRHPSGRSVPHHVLHQLEHTLSELLGVIGGCDRVLGTPIPLSYTRHTSRSLVLYLATLPLALWPIVGWMAVPCMMCISFIFLGIDEIGVEIEVRRWRGFYSTWCLCCKACLVLKRAQCANQVLSTCIWLQEPFCILPLHPLCKTVVSDVTTAMQTSSAAAA
jgi:hypothetical protein